MSEGASGITAAVIGTGFIGTVHLQALRWLGVQVTGVLGSTARRGEERAKALGVARGYDSLRELLKDPEVDVVHVASPNHLHYDQVIRILSAGKHGVCEKPLAMNSGQSRDMVELAKATQSIAAVCYNTRFYPLNQQACGTVGAGELGEVRLVTGHTHQDWLANDSDWNWGLTPEAGGALRAVGDIGTHWLDRTSFIAGMAPSEVFADLATFISERERPTAPVETFSRAAGATERVRIGTEDAGLNPLAVSEWRARLSFGELGELGEPRAEELDDLGHIGVQGLGCVGVRDARAALDRAPGRAERAPDPRPLADERAGGRGSDAARGPCRRFCGHLRGALPPSLPRRGRRAPAAGLDLGDLRGRPYGDAALRCHLAERRRGALGHGARRRTL